MTSRFIIGVFLVLLGVVLTLDQIGLMQAHHLLRFWPVILIVLGLAGLRRGDGHSAVRALVLIVVGGWLLLNTLGIVSVQFWEFIWPLVLVLVGAKIMTRPSNTPPTPGITPGAPGGAGGPGPGGPWTGSNPQGSFTHSSAPGGPSAGPGAASPGSGLSSAGLGSSAGPGFAPGGPGAASGAPPNAKSGDPVHASQFALLSSCKRRWGQSLFQSAETTAILGGCELDLRNALIGAQAAVIDVFVIMGGVNIFVPPNWTVSQEVSPVLGGVNDETRSVPSNPAQHLIVRGTVVMGGVEISN